MRINSRHSLEDRQLDAYFTPLEAIKALMAIEQLPLKLWEPCCGNGAIVKPLRDAGHEVLASDIVSYDCDDAVVSDYFKLEATTQIDGIVTNPPFKLALKFIEKAIKDAPYVAMLLRLSFLESYSRKNFFDTNPPSRVWVSSRRLPMMHRLGWEGPKAPSNTCYAWFIWDKTHTKCEIKWFDWKQLIK